MAKEFSRTQRIGDQMQRELALLIQREIKDPRLGLVTITAVDVSRDLSHAKIFITIMGQDDDQEAVKGNLRILNDAAGFLRMQLGKSMKLRMWGIAKCARPVTQTPIQKAARLEAKGSCHQSASRGLSGQHGVFRVLGNVMELRRSQNAQSSLAYFKWP